MVFIHFNVLARLDTIPIHPEVLWNLKHLNRIPLCSILDFSVGG